MDRTRAEIDTDTLEDRDRKINDFLAGTSAFQHERQMAEAVKAKGFSWLSASAFTRRTSIAWSAWSSSQASSTLTTPSSR